MDEKEIFMEVFAYMQERYPHRNITLNYTIVVIDGKEKFNIDGYNLHYNLKRLCDELDDELWR